LVWVYCAEPKKIEQYDELDTTHRIIRYMGI